MENIIVPIKSSTFKRAGREKMAEKLKKAGVNTVFLADGQYVLNPEKRKRTMADLGDNINFMKEQGFTVGVWVWTFWTDGVNDFMHQRGIDGGTNPEFACPSDKNFIAFAQEYIQQFASLGPEIILFDDDFRFGHLNGDQLACSCDNHLHDISERLGEKVTREILADKVFVGGENKYRDAWIASMGDSLYNFARKMREALDSVNKNIRMGFCACMTSWDIDGTNAPELANILAGDTKPFLRLSGAPYWVSSNVFVQNLQEVIETERMEVQFCRDVGFTGDMPLEGDPFPRPRYACPAKYLEILHCAMLADGKTKSIMKYMLDYASSADYENGYLLMNEKNKELRKNIEEIFDGKSATGVRIYDYQRKILQYEFPSDRFVKGVNVQNKLFSAAARMMSTMSIPTSYDREDIPFIYFGENARHIDRKMLSNGSVIDLRAAELLSARGIDVGLCPAYKPLPILPNEEHYIPENENILMWELPSVFAELNEDAVVQSEMCTGDGKSVTTAYTYENAEGERFLVYLAYMQDMNKNFYRNYARQAQLARCIEWVGRKKLPAICLGNPDLYMISSEGGGKLSVALWNISPDETFNNTVVLNKAAKDIRFISGGGKISENRVLLEEIPPYGCTAFEVTF